MNHIETTTTPRNLAALNNPGYFTGITVKGDGGVVEVGRDGKGDTLTFDQVIARRRMAPVRQGERTVAFIGLPADGPVQVSWGLDWTLRRENGADYFPTAEAAVQSLAFAFLT